MSAQLIWQLAALAPLAVWLGLLIWPVRPWSTREHLSADPNEHLRGRSEGPGKPDLRDVDVLIPARNEAASLEITLPALLEQGYGLRVVVVDDQSEDDTAATANSYGDSVQVVRGSERPEGWAGKLWALEQGRALLHRPLTLLLDADIVLEPGMAARLRRKLLDSSLGLVSVMAVPALDSTAARLLLPAYVYFFKLLYPFALANRPDSRVAAAAGGCLLIRTDHLKELDVFSRIRGALIDDCALARVVKGNGLTTWTGLTRGARSIRPSGGLQGIGDLVSRHAYTQLGYSPLALAGVTAAMLILFVIPPVGALMLAPPQSWQSALAWIAMAATMAPTLRYYQLSPLWGAALPLTALFYLVMCWASAWRYHLAGHRASWRGRTYSRSRYQ